MTYYIHFQDESGGDMGHIYAETVPLVGDWVTIKGRPKKKYEVKQRLFRYDATVTQLQNPEEELPMISLYVKEVKESEAIISIDPDSLSGVNDLLK